MIDHEKSLKIPKHPDPRINIEPSTESLKKRYSNYFRKRTPPQPTRALQEFVKHIADPLVNKGWNLHFKIWQRGSPRENSLFKGSSPRESTAKN